MACVNTDIRQILTWRLALANTVQSDILMCGLAHLAVLGAASSSSPRSGAKPPFADFVRLCLTGALADGSEVADHALRRSADG